MNKKGVNAAITVLILCAVVVAGVAVYVGVLKPAPAAVVITEPASITETGTTQSTGVAMCPSDGTTSAQVRYEDTLASSTTYGTPVCYFMPKSEGLERVTAGALSTSDFSTAADLKCTSAGTKWRTTCVTQKDNWTSAVEPEDFVADGAYVKRDVTGKKAGILAFKIEDKYTGAATMFNVSDYTCYGGAGSLTYVGFNGTKCAIDDKNTNTALDLATDEYIDARIYIKTNETKRQFGEDGLRTWMLVDADGSEYSEPIASRDGGAKLVDQLSALSNEDKRKYSGYEYAYEIGTVSDKESYIDFYLASASGVDPGTNDPIIEFCAEGRYTSSKVSDAILTGCWTDAATQTEVFTTNRQYFTFVVA